MPEEEVGSDEIRKPYLLGYCVVSVYDAGCLQAEPKSKSTDPNVSEVITPANSDDEILPGPKTDADKVLD
ncbi:MAG: hypothetical protein ABJA67_01485 [Chthonomonadales bacterium]